PLEVIRSKVRSTFSFSAHSRQSMPKTSLAPGTQWSQTPKVGELLVGRPDRVHLGDVEPDVLFEMVDAGARCHRRGLDAGRLADPPAFLLADIFRALHELA